MAHISVLKVVFFFFFHLHTFCFLYVLWLVTLLPHFVLNDYSVSNFVWVWNHVHSWVFHYSVLSFSFFLFSACILGAKDDCFINSNCNIWLFSTLVGLVHCLRDPQISLFSNFFIKNGFHGTIYTFKNYFTTVFSIFNFNKISSIQTDP